MNEAKLIEDVKRYQSLYEQEVKQFKGRFSKTISQDQDDLVNELSDVFADLSIRVKVLEAAVRSELFENKEIVELLKNGKNPKGLKSQYFKDAVILNADSLQKLSGFAASERTDNGLSYCWTIDRPQIRIPLLISRNTNKALKIRFVGEVKPDLISSMELYVDGIQREFNLQHDGELNYLTAMLPETTRQEKTEVIVKLQGVYSPAELSGSSDKRVLGIAISSVSVSEWVPLNSSLFRRIGRRVKRAFS